MARGKAHMGRHGLIHPRTPCIAPHAPPPPPPRPQHTHTPSPPHTRVDLSIPCSPSTSAASARAKEKLGRRGTTGRRAKSAVELRKMKRDAEFARRRGLAPADSSPNRGGFGVGSGGGGGGGVGGGAGPAKLKCPSLAVTQGLNLESLSKLDEVPMSMAVDAAAKPQLVRSSSVGKLKPRPAGTRPRSSPSLHPPAIHQLSAHARVRVRAGLNGHWPKHGC